MSHRGTGKIFHFKFDLYVLSRIDVDNVLGSCVIFWGSGKEEIGRDEIQRALSMRKEI
jgi:hypothetical protein